MLSAPILEFSYVHYSAYIVCKLIQPNGCHTNKIICSRVKANAYHHWSRWSKVIGVKPGLMLLSFLLMYITASANHFQVGFDHLQVPSWFGAVLLGWRVHPRFVGRRLVAVAVGRQRDTRCATHQDYDRSARLCCVGPGHGTASPSNCGLHRCLLRRLRKNSKVIYSAASASEDFCLTGAI